MNHDTLIFIIIGAAVTGAAYFLWKQEQAPNDESGLGFVETLAGGSLGSAVGGVPDSTAFGNESGQNALTGAIYGQI